MGNKRRFFHGRFLSIDIDKIISIHQNIYIERPEFFIYIEGISEKVVLCENDYDALYNILNKETLDIDNILDKEVKENVESTSDKENKEFRIF